MDLFDRFKDSPLFANDDPGTEYLKDKQKKNRVRKLQVQIKSRKKRKRIYTKWVH